MQFNTTNSYHQYSQYAQLVAQIGFVSTTFFCFILIFLTMFWVTRKFGSYKYLLIIFPTFGIVFATIELVLYPNVHSYNAGFVYYSTHHPFNFGKEAVTWLIALYSGVYATTISLLSVQFLYRYWAVFDETKLRYFKGWKFLFSLAYAFSVGVVWALILYYLDKMDDYSKSYMKNEMCQKYAIDINEIAGVIVVAYDTTGSIRWLNVSCTLGMTFIMLFQYTIIISCAVQMYSDMEAKLGMLSPSLRTLHQQFFKTLVIQIVTPTCTLFFPVMLIIHLPLLDLELSLPTGIFLCAFTLYPAMDAAIVMYIVQDYRKAVKQKLKAFFETMVAMLTVSTSK